MYRRPFGREEDLVLDLPDVVHRGVRGSVDLDHVEADPAAMDRTSRSIPQGFDRRALLAVECLGENAAPRSSFRSRGGRKEIGMGDPSGREGASRVCGNEFLAGELIEGLGALAGAVIS